jgi:hypothetical protein
MPTYQSGYAGTDIVCVFKFPDFVKKEPLVFGELATISFSTYRDKFPVRALGHVNAKGYTKAGRTVAGSLIFTMFEKSIINQIVEEIYSKKFNIIPDELPAFSIDITMANEYGNKTHIALFGVEIVEGNQVMTVDTLQTNEQYSFVAQDIVLVDSEKKPGVLSYYNPVTESREVNIDKDMTLRELEKEFHYTYQVPENQKIEETKVASKVNENTPYDEIRASNEKRIEEFIGNEGLATVLAAINYAEGDINHQNPEKRASVPYGTTGFKSNGYKFVHQSNNDFFNNVVDNLDLKDNTNAWFAASSATTVTDWWEGWLENNNRSLSTNFNDLSESEQKDFLYYLGSNYAPGDAHHLNENWYPNVIKYIYGS